jgi:hypothetical protein
MYTYTNKTGANMTAFTFLELDQVEYRGEVFSRAHGSPFDRGSADSYYHRAQVPHKGGVGGDSGPRIAAQDLTLAEMRAYYAGYEYNEQYGEKKNWD